MARKRSASTNFMKLLKGALKKIQTARVLSRSRILEVGSLKNRVKASHPRLPGRRRQASSV